MKLIEQDLYQFSTYVPPIDLSFNQYLLAADEPILFHTGDVRQAAEFSPGFVAAGHGPCLRLK